MATITKAELETINEALQIEIRTLRRENARLNAALAQLTTQYEALTTSIARESERTKRLEQRYARLKRLLDEYAEQTETRARKTTGW